MFNVLQIMIASTEFLHNFLTSRMIWMFNHSFCTATECSLQHN